MTAPAGAHSSEGFEHFEFAGFDDCDGLFVLDGSESVEGVLDGFDWRIGTRIDSRRWCRSARRWKWWSKSNVQRSGTTATSTQPIPATAGG
jgi:hypothetical protein